MSPPARSVTAPRDAAGAPIPRGARARERVLTAALEVLTDHGMPGFTMEAVAVRARASKATVYRHWRTRAALLVDAMDRALPPFPPPATGDLRGDLVEILSRLEAHLDGQPFPRLMAAFVDAAERDPALAGLQFRITESRREPVRALLAAARDRGEIPSSADLEIAVDLLAGPAFYRRLIAHRPFPDAHAEAVVDHVLSALRGLPEG